MKYYLKPDGPVWKVWPAEGPGGVLTATKVEFVNVHGACEAGCILIEGVIKVNGIQWMNDQDAIVQHARFQPPPQIIKVDPIRARSRTVKPA